MTTTTAGAPVIGSSTCRDAALRDLLVVVPGVVPFGLVLGITVATVGTDPAAGILGAGLVYAGSAQLATLLQLGSGAVAAVLVGVVVNARILLYGAALEPWFRDQPLWFRAIGPQFLLDQTYLAAVEHPGLRGREFRRYWAWLGYSLLVVWVVAVAVGVLAGPLLPDLPHLLLVGAALFLGMLVPRVVDRPGLAAAVVGGCVAGVATQVAPAVAILAGSIAGVIAALAARRREERTP